jgi:hypothetical protein
VPAARIRDRNYEIAHLVSLNLHAAVRQCPANEWLEGSFIDCPLSPLNGGHNDFPK